ncbi:MAG: nucleoside deaminase [Actinomycetota bacterium]
MSGGAAARALAPPWPTVFEEAWTSWRVGNYGVGAVLVDPDAGAIVATGRNRVAEEPSVPGVLAGNMTAHAEMNAFATMTPFNAQGLHLYTTLEPCLMCAATAMQLKVEAVHFAAVDEFYDGMAELWDEHPVTAARQLRRSGPFDGELAPLAAFARLLPLSFTLREFPHNSAARLAREREPALSSLADDIVGELGAVDDLTWEGAVDRWWDRLGGD